MLFGFVILLICERSFNMTDDLYGSNNLWCCIENGHEQFGYENIQKTTGGIGIGNLSL